MKINTKPLSAVKRQAITELARKCNIPETFLSLKIRGLYEVAVSKEMSQKNKEIIFRFLNHISPEVSESRLTFYTHKLRKLSLWAKKDFDEITEEEIRSLVTFLTKGPARLDGGMYSKGTLHGYKVALKRFYRWLEGDEEEYPRKVRWIKTNGGDTRIHEPEQLLTKNEINEMIRHAKNPRDTALVSFLYESGARISEILSMKVKHLEFFPNLVKATLPVSKTQPRVIPMVSCKGHLSVWMNYHPLKDNPDAPLWSNLKGTGDSPLYGQTVRNILIRIARKAGIRKRIYPHLFRACSITHKQLGNWPEQAIKLFHGLSKDSKVMKHYSHLSYGSLEQIQLKMNGLPVSDEFEQNGVKCQGCGKVNPLYMDACKCGLPIGMRIIPESQRKIEEEFEARLERKFQEMVEKRNTYDVMMTGFMKALIKKTKQSPELQHIIGEISSCMNNQMLRAGRLCTKTRSAQKVTLTYD